MKERLEYLEYNNWSLRETTKQIVEEYRKTKQKDVDENFFSWSIRKKENARIQNNSLNDEEENIKKIYEFLKKMEFLKLIKIIMKKYYIIFQI